MGQFFRPGSPAARLVAWLSEEGRSGPPPAEFQGQLANTDDFGGFGSPGYKVPQKPTSVQSAAVEQPLVPSPAMTTGQPAQASTGPGSFAGPFPAVPEANAGPSNMFPNVPADKPIGGYPKLPDFTDEKYIPEDTMTQGQFAADQNRSKAMGEMTFATGLNMLAKASTMPDFKGMLGGMGTTIAGMAQMSGKGGKWAMPVAMISTLTYLAGERNSANMQVKRNVRLANAYGRALQMAGGKYGK
jgi:hypothetical protein